VNALSRRDFLGLYTKENLKHVFKAFHSMKEGEKETSRRSCDEATKMFLKKRLHKT
jgi:hypothetical protein